MESETVKNLNADFSKYDIEFYDSFSQISYRAALKMLTELRRKFEYSSVVDFGCGSGTWLKAAREVILEKQDIPNLLGIDGEYARKIVDQKRQIFCLQIWRKGFI